MCFRYKERQQHDERAFLRQLLCSFRYSFVVLLNDRGGLCQGFRQTRGIFRQVPICYVNRKHIEVINGFRRVSQFAMGGLCMLLLYQV